METSNKSIESALKAICHGFDYKKVHWQDRIYLRDHFKEVVLTKRMHNGDLVTFDEQFPNVKNMKITRYKWPLSDEDMRSIEKLNNRNPTYIVDGYKYYLSWD
jgi:hypothetical protein